MKKQKKIFLGVQEIAGMMERLNNAFREMGMESDFYCMDKYTFTSEQKKNNTSILKKFYIHSDKRCNATNEYEKNWWYFLQMWDILYIFFYVLYFH